MTKKRVKNKKQRVKQQANLDIVCKMGNDPIVAKIARTGQLVGPSSEHWMQSIKLWKLASHDPQRAKHRPNNMLCQTKQFIQHRL